MQYLNREIKEKLCSVCNEIKPLTRFRKNKTGAGDGRMGYCRDCWKLGAEGRARKRQQSIPQ